LRKHTAAGNRPPAITPELRHALISYHWPGNVRELENIMRRFIVLRDPSLIARELQARTARKPLASTPAALPLTSEERVPEPAAPAPAPPPILEQVIRAKQQAEAEAIVAALNSTRWNRKQAAALLKIDYKALLYKMKKLGVEDHVIPLSTPAEEPRVKVAGAAGQ
jgi:DNA-binding NtrC family response regulator